MYADLHIHTNVSDGSDTVEEIIAHARQNQVSIIAITDHNTLKAYSDPGIEEARVSGLTIIPGVEIDVNHNGRSYHMLGLGVDIANQELLSLCADSADKQEKYNVDLLHLLERDIPTVSEEDYNHYQIPAGRGGWKLLNYLLDIGVVHDLREALYFYMQYGFNVNDIPFVSLEQAVKVVKAASGIPIIAHPGEDIPYNPYDLSHEEFWDSLESILSTGIEGIECIHPVHDFALEQDLLAFCQDRGLLISGGSDYHGQFYSRQKQKVGGQFVKTEQIQGLLERLNV